MPELRSSHVSCSCVFSLRPLLANLRWKQAAKHSSHSERSMQTRLRTLLCLGGYQIQKLFLWSSAYYIGSYVHLLVLMTLCASSDSSGERSWFACGAELGFLVRWHELREAGESIWFVKRVGGWQGSFFGQTSGRGYQLNLTKDVFLCALWVSFL